MDVKFKQGFVSNGKNKNVGSLQEALSLKAKCQPCGCDDCYCYETLCGAEDGETLVRYYTGNAEDGYTEVIEPYDVGIEKLKQMYKARKQG